MRRNGANNSTRGAYNNGMMVMLSITYQGHCPMNHASSCLYCCWLGHDGSLLFKLIIHLATIDSKATSKVLCNNLQTIDSFMTTCTSDIKKFHLHFSTNYSQLVGDWLWDGYKNCANSAFRKYMKSKKMISSKAKKSINDINFKRLITMATSKYNILKSGKLGAKSPGRRKLFPSQLSLVPSRASSSSWRI